MTEYGLHELRLAICIQAYKDYKKNAKRIDNLLSKDTSEYSKKELSAYNTKIKNCRNNIDDVEKFFNSSWFDLLMPTIDREIILKELKKI